eukprot:38675-Pleurochrysis_carterae.AAC.3
MCSRAKRCRATPIHCLEQQKYQRFPGRRGCQEPCCRVVPSLPRRWRAYTTRTRSAYACFRRISARCAAPREVQVIQYKEPKKRFVYIVKTERESLEIHSSRHFTSLMKDSHWVDGFNMK